MDIGKRLAMIGRPGLRIRDLLAPGDVEGVVRLHGSIYGAEYGFDPSFGNYVAEPLGRFAAGQTDRERIWLVEESGSLKGSIAIVEHSRPAAQLRWFLLHPDLRGLGLGRTLVEEALRFCRSKDYDSVFLWTLSILEVAARIYRQAGFRLAEQKESRLWGRQLTEQRYQLSL
jgi:GNAT superfamily N-acetyltransferase